VIKIVVLNYNKSLFRKEDYIKKITSLKSYGNIIAIFMTETFPEMLEELKDCKVPYDYLALSYGTILINKDHNILYQYTIHPNVAKRINKDLKLFETVVNFKLFSLYEDNVEYQNDLVKLITILLDHSECAEIIRYIGHKYRNYVSCYHNRDQSLEFVSVHGNLNAIFYAILKDQNLNFETVQLYHILNKKSISRPMYSFKNVHKEELSKLPYRELDSLERPAYKTNY